MVRRLAGKGHECIVHDAQPAAVAQMREQGFDGADSLDELVAKLARPRAIWLMVPAGVVDPVLRDLVAHLDAGDIVIDGGNSYYHDDIRRAGELDAAGLHYLDVGTSGGVAGRDRGYCLMIGGEATDRVAPGADLPARWRRAWAPPGAPRGARARRPASRKVSCTVGRMAPATSSRWSTTESSTASWRHMPKG